MSGASHEFFVSEDVQRTTKTKRTRKIDKSGKSCRGPRTNFLCQKTFREPFRRRESEKLIELTQTKRRKRKIDKSGKSCREPRTNFSFWNTEKVIRKRLRASAQNRQVRTSNSCATTLLGCTWLISFRFHVGHRARRTHASHCLHAATEQTMQIGAGPRRR